MLSQNQKVRSPVTESDRSFLVTEARDLVNELSSAAGRAQIRAEHIALTAAATRAQRILLTLEQTAASPIPLSAEQPELPGLAVS